MKKEILVLTVLCFSFNFLNAQLKIASNGNVVIGNASSGSALNIKGSDKNLIHANGTYSFSSGDNIKSTVNRQDAYTYAGYYQNSRTFFVSGYGWIYSQGVYLGSDQKLKKILKKSLALCLKY